MFTSAPNNYSNTIVPGARVDGEIYPFAFGNPNGSRRASGSAACTIGLRAQRDVVVQLMHEVCGHATALLDRPAVPHHVRPPATSPSLVIGVGYGIASSRSIAAQLDSATRSTSRCRLSRLRSHARVPAAAVASARAQLRRGRDLLTGAGPIQTQAEYGQATVTAGEGDLGFDILFTPRMGVRLSFDAAQIGYKFKGNGG